MKNEREERPAAADGSNPGGLGANVRLKLFARSSVLDFLLVLAVSTALVLTVSFAFESAPDYRGDIALVAGCNAVLLAALYAGSWSRRAIVPSAAATVVLGAGMIAFAAASMPSGTPLFVNGQVNDVAENYVVFAFVLVCTPVLTYLLSRRTPGLVALLGIAIVACGMVQFLYRDWIAENSGLLVTVAALVGIGMLFVYQTYRQSVYTAKRVKKTSFAGAFAYAAIIMGVCAGLAALLYCLVIAPLGLTTVNIKPFQDYYQRPVVEYTGVYDRQQVESKDDTTDETNDNVEKTNQDAESQDDQNGSMGQTAQSLLAGVATVLEAFDPNNWDQDYDAVSYETIRLTTAAVFLLIVAIVLTAVLARRSVRERRLKKLEGRPLPYRIWFLYGFLLGRLKRLGMGKPASLTPMEFALGSQRAMAPFARGTDGVDFVRVTDVYQRSCFGSKTVTEAEYGDVVRYYRAFFKNARRQVGGVRWLWKFWRI